MELEWVWRAVYKIERDHIHQAMLNLLVGAPQFEWGGDAYGRPAKASSPPVF